MPSHRADTPPGWESRGEGSPGGAVLSFDEALFGVPGRPSAHPRADAGQPSTRREALARSRAETGGITRVHAPGLASGRATDHAIGRPAFPETPARGVSPVLPSRRELRERERRGSSGSRRGSLPPRTASSGRAATDHRWSESEFFDPLPSGTVPLARVLPPELPGQAFVRPPAAGRSSVPGSFPIGEPGGTTPRRRSQTWTQVARGRASNLSGAQIGIAGVLGLATIAAPLSGAIVLSSPRTVIGATTEVVVPQPEFPQRKAETSAIDLLSVVPAEESDPSSEVPAGLRAPTLVLVTRASRSNERPVLPGCDGIVPVTDVSNGQLPSSDLCTLWDPRHRLRADAAVAFAKLNIAFRQEFGGDDMCLTDSYRTLSVQKTLKSEKPGLAATPGTSEHGWGLAVDMCDGVETGSGARYTWLRHNAPAYGWDNPAWARAGGSGPHEPWHWEYVAGE